jgi:hypothetical protein
MSTNMRRHYEIKGRWKRKRAASGKGRKNKKRFMM